MRTVSMETVISCANTLVLEEKLHLSKRSIFWKTYNIDKEGKYSTSKFWQFYPEDLKTWCRNWNGNQGKSFGHGRFYKQTEKCKPNWEDGFWYWYTLLRYMETNDMTIGLCTDLCKMEKSTRVMHKLKYSIINRNHFPNFNNLQLLRLVKLR